MTAITDSSILILDFGSQYTQLIARRVRECGVYSEIADCGIDVAELKARAPAGIILSGSPHMVGAEDAPKVSLDLFDIGIPILGICYGMQLMAQSLGGTVVSTGICEFGYAKLQIINDQGLFYDVADHEEAGHIYLDVWMSHGDSVSVLPPGFVITAQTATTPIAAMADFSRQLYGFQFHPEVTQSKQGARLLENFVCRVCGCAQDWTPANFIPTTMQQVQQQVGQERVLLGLSGGVDSSVVAALLHRAIGKQLVCVFVDTGLLRLNEGNQVMDLFSDHLGVEVIRVNAQARFMQALKGIEDPEKKRKVIGTEFVRVFEEAARQIEGVRWLAQGTIYPDVIESAQIKNGKAHVIKSHHNVGGLPADMQLQLLEPLRCLFKDEVRKLGLQLGLPRDLVYRHPFPGPGLGVRVLGEVKAEYISILQQADAIFLDMLREADLYDEIGQAFAVFLPVKSVGVKGDARCYSYVIALRAVTTVDFMTARWTELPYTFIAKVSERIMNEVAQVSRVVYDVSSKPPSTIEWE